MKGHQQIIKLRKAGLKPSHVMFMVGDRQHHPEHPWPPQTAPHELRMAMHREMVIEEAQYPEVYTMHARPVDADLRFLVGLRVSAVQQHGTNDADWSKWIAALDRANPEFLCALDLKGRLHTWSNRV